MNKQVQLDLLGYIPDQVEFNLLNYKRVWDLAIPYEFIKDDIDPYHPLPLPKNYCSSYFNLQESIGDYVNGKILFVNNVDLPKLDSFEDVNFDFMKRTIIDDFIFYFGDKKFQDCFATNFKEGLVFISSLYLRTVKNTTSKLSTPICKNDTLVIESFSKSIL